VTVATQAEAGRRRPEDGAGGGVDVSRLLRGLKRWLLALDKEVAGATRPEIPNRPGPGELRPSWRRGLGLVR